jgi:hypothetical protein
MDLREQLTSIYEARGQLTPQDVVDEATPKTSPLHSRFEWNDKIAGPRYRLVQAQELIRSVKVAYRNGSDEDDHLRAFVSVPRESGFVYEPVERVVEDDMLTRITLQAMEREWRSMRRRYARFEAFWKMIQKDAEAA